MRILKKTIYIFEFVVFYFIKLIQSNVIIAYEILTPKRLSKPAFLNIDVDIKSDFGLLLFSNLVSMTPGSLCVDLSDDKKEMKIHILYNDSLEKIEDDISKIQNKIIRISK